MTFRRDYHDLQDLFGFISIKKSIPNFWEITKRKNNNLNNLLSTEKRYDELARAVRSREYQKQLFKEYCISWN
jgi:hypothetical protein